MEDPLLLEDPDEFPILGQGDASSTTEGWVTILPGALSAGELNLRHSASSPNMRVRDGLLTNIDDDSFTMVPSSGPTVSNNSYLDAILMQGSSENGEESTSTTTKAATTVVPRMRPAIYEVRSIPRCIKSTGDLMSLASTADDNYAVGEVMAGDDHYHRKALGAKGRASGLRLRPDELKRKVMIVHKKNLQRAQA
jgi:hypothetical protein